MELKQAYQSRVTTHSRNALAPSYLNTVPLFTNFLLLNSDVNLQSVLHGPCGCVLSSGRDVAAGGELLVLGHAPAIGAASPFAACAEPA